MKRDAPFDYAQHAEAPVPEDQIRRVMADLGFDYMQARNHVRGRLWLQGQTGERRKVYRERDFVIEMKM